MAFNNITIIRVFIKRKLFSVETVLSPYMHMGTHTHTHTLHTQAPTHMSILTIQGLIYTKRAANRNSRRVKMAALNGKL